jgi:hypothetical protein
MRTSRNKSHITVHTIGASRCVSAAAGFDEIPQVMGSYFEHMPSYINEAGVALADALAVNETLRTITLSATAVVTAHRNEPTIATLGARSYEAYSAMLRVNTGGPASYWCFLRSKCVHTRSHVLHIRLKAGWRRIIKP